MDNRFAENKNEPSRKRINDIWCASSNAHNRNLQSPISRPTTATMDTPDSPTTPTEFFNWLQASIDEPMSIPSAQQLFPATPPPTPPPVPFAFAENPNAPVKYVDPYYIDNINIFPCRQLISEFDAIEHQVLDLLGQVRRSKRLAQGIQTSPIKTKRHATKCANCKQWVPFYNSHEIEPLCFKCEGPLRNEIKNLKA